MEYFCTMLASEMGLKHLQRLKRRKIKLDRGKLIGTRFCQTRDLNSKVGGVIGFRLWQIINLFYCMFV